MDRGEESLGDNSPFDTRTRVDGRKNQYTPGNPVIIGITPVPLAIMGGACGRNPLPTEPT